MSFLDFRAMARQYLTTLTKDELLDVCLNAADIGSLMSWERKAKEAMELSEANVASIFRGTLTGKRPVC